MRTSYSLGFGFTMGIRVTALPQDIPFVATPDRLRELVKPEGVKEAGASKVEVTKVARQAKSSRRAENRGSQRKASAKHEVSAKHSRSTGITTLRGDKNASDGFKKTVRRELDRNFYTPDDDNRLVPPRRTSRSRGADHSKFSKSALLLLEDMSRAYGVGTSKDSAALLKARDDFYTSREKPACTGLAYLFDREDVVSVQEQKDICRTCPLIDKCLKMALLGDESFGVWGGLDPKERTALKRKSMRMRRSNALGGINA